MPQRIQKIMNANYPMVALLLGVHAVCSDPSTFVSEQLPSTLANAATPIPSSALILSYTLGNIFLLLAGFAVLCTVWTRDAGVTKGYLFIVACADLGHIYSSYQVMGPKVFWDFQNYNSMMWGNIGFSAFLHVNRGLTLIGAFGKVGRK